MTERDCNVTIASINPNPHVLTASDVTVVPANSFTPSFIKVARIRLPPALTCAVVTSGGANDASNTSYRERHL